MDNEHYLAAVIALKQQAELARQRRLLVLSGDRAWAVDLALLIIKQLGGGSALWLTDELKSGHDTQALDIDVTPAKKAIRHLGSERKLIVMDAYAGFHPDGFGAISGTLQSGGLFILLAPNLNQWSAYDDPDYDRVTSPPFCRSELDHRFIARVANAICASEHALTVNQGQPVTCDSVTIAQAEPRSERLQFDGCLTLDQKHAVTAVCKVVTGHRRRPLVITSDRGRGKSAALGIAAAKLIGQGLTRIILTAPFIDSVESAFLMLQKQFPAGKRHGSKFSSKGDAVNEVTFVAPDELISASPDADLVLVDEAAAIPAPMLEALLKRYSRIVYASTIHGYEGTGRGFAVRFIKVLDQLTPQWQSLHLKSPIRWAEGDPLEQLVFHSLLLNASPSEPEEGKSLEPDSVVCRWLEQEALAQDEALLNQIFGLLVLAHYRTSPEDLRMLLDGPSLRIAALFDGACVVAVVLVAREGGLDRATGDMIWQGRRRPRGHLIPQSLSSFSGFHEATNLIGHRVMRIAVHPKLHRFGLGRRLLHEVFKYARNDEADYIGASFGATSDLLDFWLSAGFSVLRLGFQRDAASGTHSVIVMNPVSSAAEALRKEAQQRFTEQFIYDLSGSFRGLDVGIIQRLLHSNFQLEYTLSKRDIDDLTVFSEHQRMYESCSFAVFKLVMNALIHGSAGVLDAEEAPILVRRVVQKNNPDEIVSECSLTGKKELGERLRRAVRALLLWYKQKC
ncbi:tRNA(Met) cytidine acetyltransferase TmcA [Alkalimarinus coralli]|uniref:tRNA(Met) cytidine acetyltransferase TmcA n=1 Tax=Alkalimarinus coralli TaxID=2935863 RepID=UPI00202B3717|nr:GNAT family N-acetyltransferase [Alkalimarinus coralli]